MAYKNSIPVEKRPKASVVKKIGNFIGYGLAAICGLSVMALIVAGTIKIITWMF